ncbi:antiviral reverse transcriptase Drt4 [Pseudomonas faucium]|uniref:antiviral reverse transcriptase Drt4 n=1 Tax=Pseudomonas faucium TaxID=2740518 RepID=UPI001F3E93B3|nr:antiviral reverse transcriptase Drt4 [Pseudomonas faucium]
MDEVRFVFEALTQHNFFPNQKSGVGELPPIFSTRRFTPEIVNLIAEVGNSDGRGTLGFDLVEYSATRYNNVPRILGIPHPKAYGRLVRAIVDNWESIRHVCDNESSKIKPYFHADSRLMVMNYEGFREKVIDKCKKSFGKRFLVNTDISGCFNSIYSHAIEWAGVGLTEAKEGLATKVYANHWAKLLDKAQSRTRRGETQGVTIGPATSSVIVELILSKVDSALDEFEFSRYVDDYVCYCSDSGEADRFLRTLAAELKKYKLSLNLGKTVVESLPSAIQTDWISKLHAALPAVDDEGRYQSEVVMRYIEYAISLNEQTPDGSVLKYAIRQIVYRVEKSSASVIVDYFINLSWHYPLLLPFIGLLFELHDLEYSEYEERLNLIILENARNSRSDGMCWPLYFIYKYNLRLGGDAFSSVLGSRDCLALCVVMLITGWNGEFEELAQAIVSGSDYDKDQQWVFLYQAFLKGYIANPYQDTCFDVMREECVDFMPIDDSKSRAENYCVYLYAGRVFSPEEKTMSYKEYVQKHP